MRSEFPPAPTSLNLPHSRGDLSQRQTIADLLKEPGNDRCADCEAQIDMDNTWAILSYGILVCDDCKLVHIEHQNYCSSPDDGDSSENSANGILSTQFAHIWEDKDIAQIKANGNKRTNDNLLKNLPAWQYRPSANDGIKLKEYWITCKYSGKAGEGAENPVAALKKSFLAFQFVRPMPEGNSYHCCAVLQDEKLYLTSDKKNEEVPLDCIETVIVNSKRIGHENGVQLTYRTNKKDGNIASYTYLQHESMDTVMNWVNLILYAKYNLLKKTYPNLPDHRLTNILNCGVVKESYSYIQSRGLIYISVSEARLCCFKHHLDEQPLFQIAVSELMNLDASQYLDALACFFDIDANKIQSYADWFNALELVLKTDKIANMPDDFPKPTFPFSLLKKSEKPVAPVEKAEPAVNKEKNISITPVTQATEASKSPPPVMKKLVDDNDKDVDKTSGSYECYPPIGPMGEMGKVFRGELSPDAIKPPPSKTDIARVGMFGDYLPQLPGQLPLTMKSVSYTEFPGLNSLSTANTSIMNPAISKESTTCYPPIGGPVQTRKLQQYDMNTLSALQQAAVLRREQEQLEELRNNQAALLQNPLLRSTLATKQSLFEQARLPTSLGGVSDATFAAASLGQSQYSSWGDANAAENILTVPWKPTTNGYEPARNFNHNGQQFSDMWNSKVQAANSFGSWSSGRSSSVDLTAQSVMGRNLNNWGAAGLASSAPIDHWNSKSHTIPNDLYMLNQRDVRAAAASSTGLYGAQNNRNVALNGPVRHRNESPSGNHANMVIDNLVRQWQLAEQRLLTLIHNSYVPGSDMSPAGLDKDSAEHAYTCVNELFDLLWKQRYDLALSFLRGFREVFANSSNPDIRNQFIGQGELDTMRNIFLNQGKEKFLSASSGGPPNWKNSTTTPPPQTTQNESAWPTSRSTSVQENSGSFSPWGSLFSGADPWSGNGSLAAQSTRSASISSDPWNTNPSSMFSASANMGGSSFNRAPSRPSNSQSSVIGDNTPPDGSKASSDSTSPRVITPTSNYDSLLASGGVNHIDSLKNLFLGD